MAHQQHPLFPARVLRQLRANGLSAKEVEGIRARQRWGTLAKQLVDTAWAAVPGAPRTEKERLVFEAFADHTEGWSSRLKDALWSVIRSEVLHMVNDSSQGDSHAA
jgi:hypothetical protein